MDIEYVQVGDYLLPAIKLSDPPPLAYYGMRHKAYLREHRPILYNRLLLMEQLFPLCREIDEAATHRLTVIHDRLQAEEIINKLIYD